MVSNTLFKIRPAGIVASAASKAADYILACRDTASTDLDVAGEDEADGFELEGRLAA